MTVNGERSEGALWDATALEEGRGDETGDSVVGLTSVVAAATGSAACVVAAAADVVEALGDDALPAGVAFGAALRPITPRPCASLFPGAFWFGVAGPTGSWFRVSGADVSAAATSGAPPSGCSAKDGLAWAGVRFGTLGVGGASAVEGLVWEEAPAVGATEELLEAIAPAASGARAAVSGGVASATDGVTVRDGAANGSGEVAGPSSGFGALRLGASDDDDGPASTGVAKADAVAGCAA